MAERPPGFFKGFSPLWFVIKTNGHLVGVLGMMSLLSEWSATLDAFREHVRQNDTMLLWLFGVWNGLFSLYELDNMQRRHNIEMDRWRRRIERAKSEQ